MFKPQVDLTEMSSIQLEIERRRLAAVIKEIRQNYEDQEAYLTYVIEELKDRYGLEIHIVADVCDSAVGVIMTSLMREQLNAKYDIVAKEVA